MAGFGMVFEILQQRQRRGTAQRQIAVLLPVGTHGGVVPVDRRHRKGVDRAFKNGNALTRRRTAQTEILPFFTSGRIPLKVGADDTGPGEPRLAGGVLPHKDAVVVFAAALVHDARRDTRLDDFPVDAAS